MVKVRGSLLASMIGEFSQPSITEYCAPEMPRDEPTKKVQCILGLEEVPGAGKILERLLENSSLAGRE